MKALKLNAVLGIALLCSGSTQAQQSVSLTLARADGQEYFGADFLVSVQNTTTNPIGIYREWNSWGYSSLSFIAETTDGKEVSIEKGMKSFTRNFPDCFEVHPGAAYTVPVYFNPKVWKGLEVTHAKGTKIKAIFKQVQLEDDFRRYSRWRDVQIFTNRLESGFVRCDIIPARAANKSLHSTRR